jgi:hypothetical protein
VVKTIPAKAGMNRFAWDLRYDDPIQTPVAFYPGNPPRGPLALPGDYQVKLTANGASETTPLHLAIDPRIKGGETGLRRSFELQMKVRDRFSQLHQAINEIRDTRSQIESFRTRFAANESLKPAMTAADELEKKMSGVEENLIQVKMKSSEGNLVYPNMLNEMFYTFSRVIEADAAPTEPQLEVFKLMDQRLEDQLKSWAQIKSEDVPKVNSLIKAADIPALSVSAPAPSTPAPVSPPSPAAESTPGAAAPAASTPTSNPPVRRTEISPPAQPAAQSKSPVQTMTADGSSLPVEVAEESPSLSPAAGSTPPR